MTAKIQDLPRFHADCIDYRKRIDAIEDENIKTQAKAMYDTFINSVIVLDQSIDNLAGNGPVFGNEHQLIRENLHKSRLDLIKWLKRYSPLERTNPIPTK